MFPQSLTYKVISVTETARSVTIELENQDYYSEANVRIASVVKITFNKTEHTIIDDQYTEVSTANKLALWFAKVGDEFELVPKQEWPHPITPAQKS